MRHHHGSRTDRPIAAALDAAREGRRDDFLRIMGERIDPIGEAGADHLWLQAEYDYVRARYESAVFKFRQFDEQRPSAAAWQRYLSAHRQAFALHELGLVDESEAAQRVAEQIVETEPSCADRRPDALAMRAHFLELRGAFDGAMAVMKLAYGDATARNNEKRASTVASDIARISGILGRAQDALHWLDTAEAHLDKRPNLLTRRTARLRRGMVMAMLGLHEDAIRIYDDLLQEILEDGLTPGVEVDTFARSGDSLTALGRLNEAIEALSASVARAANHGLVRHELYGRKDLAMTLIKMGTGTSLAQAATEFRLVIAGLRKVPRPAPLMVTQLAEDVLAFPALVGRTQLPPDRERDLRQCLDSAREDSKPSLYQQSVRIERLNTTVSRIQLILEGLTGEVLQLSQCTIDFSTRRVRFPDGSSKQIDNAVLAVLQFLAQQDRPVSPARIVDHFQISIDNAQKRLQRLKAAIADDLAITRRRNARLYALQAAVPKDQKNQQ